MRLVLALLLMWPVAVIADSRLPDAPLANTQLEDPGQEAAAKALMLTIRCLVCEGQSVADSNAEMAGDMRSLIRTRIANGESPEAIRAWLIARYGTGVSYDPGFEPETALLWVVPMLILGTGVMLVRGRLKRKA